ncbi:MAG: hypothetical protein HRT99_03510 [Mycoplasmatales bacterium]|nr:hypothetical protein [Mycoplasmatales bacterium]
MNLDKRDELINLFDKYKGFLTQSQRQTLHLYLIEDLSFTEIAEILATTRQAIYDSIKKAENKLNKVESLVD